MSNKKRKSTRARSCNFGMSDLLNLGGPLLSQFGGDNELSNGLGSVASGAAMGSTFGPIGTAAGGVLGLAKFAFGAKDRSKQRQIQRDYIRSQKAVKHRTTLDPMGNEMAMDFELNNPIIPTFQFGGNTGNKAWVNDGETIAHPNMDMKNIKDNSGIVDNVLVNLPNNSSVFTDSINIPGTNYTFADRAKELKKVKDTKYRNTDKFANKSKELNEQYVEKELMNLSMQQQMAKEKAGKTNATFKTGSTPAFANGLENFFYKGSPFGERKPYPFSQSLDLDPNPVLPAMSFGVGKGKSKAANPTKGNVSPQAVPTMKAPTNDKIIEPSINPVGATMKTGKIDPIVASANTFPGVGVTQEPNKPGTGLLDKLPNILTDYLSLSPYRYNMSEGNKMYDVVTPEHNPYEASINRSMRARRISDQPARQAIERQRSVSRYNASRNIRGTGSGMAYNLANDAMFARAEIDAINQAQHQNNQYVGEYANVMDSLGQQRVNANRYAEDMTARNKAARDAHKGMAATQMGQWAQNKALMTNQQKTDEGLLAALKPYLSEVMASGDLQSILSKIKR